jgi:glycosyltransferase involved in cell wall biosynthesis
MLVMPSYYEPFGIVALEAMACGRPVIATSVGGLPEFMEHGRQGYLVPPGDHLQLARRIVELLEHPELGGAMGKAGLRRSHLYTWTAAANMTCNLYNQTVQAGCGKEDSRVVYGLQRELMRGLEKELRPGVRDLLSINN